MASSTLEFTLSQDESQTEVSEEILQQLEEMSQAYDKYLESLDEEPEIGYCGFICDGGCNTCKGAGTFNLEDEI